MSGNIAAQPEGCQQVEALHVVLRVLAGAAIGHPPDPVATGPVDLGQPTERRAQGVVRQRGHGNETGAVIGHLVIDLVAEDHQLVLLRDAHDGAKSLFRIDGPVGLLGLMTTIPRVRGVTSLAMASGSGWNPASGRQG